MPHLDHTDIVLLLLGAPSAKEDLEGRLSGITRLEKLAFLLERETRFQDHAGTNVERFHFHAYHYGPYTREIYDAVDLLVAIGLVEETLQYSASALDEAEEIEALDPADLGIVDAARANRYRERVFELSEKGRYVSRVLAERVGPSAVADITALKDRFGDVPLRQLLRYVYNRHPDMTTKSRIRGEL